MSEFHPLQVNRTDASQTEAVSSHFAKAGLLRAREKTLIVLEEIRAQLKVGMSEEEARKLCLAVFQAHGVTKHWHRPYVRFGEGTLLTFNHTTSPDSTLKENDPYYLDLGPVWKDEELGLEYEGDYGDTFVFGKNPEAEKCAKTARDLFLFVREKWQQEKITGEQIYQCLKEEVSKTPYQLDLEVEGHRVSDFPHHRYSKEHLSRVVFTPTDTLWVLEVKINHPELKIGAFFEDIL